jgi:hypothetical protein
MHEIANPHDNPEPCRSTAKSYESADWQAAHETRRRFASLWTVRESRDDRLELAKCLLGDVRRSAPGYK